MVSKYFFCHVTFFGLLVGAGLLPAQIVHEGGSPPSWGLKTASQAVPAFKLPSVENKAPEEKNYKDPENPSPQQFAIPHKTNLNPSNSGIWSDLGNGDRIWRLELSSEGALNINVIFSEYELLPGEKVFIYNADRSHLLGPFTHRNNKSWGRLATLPVTGDKIIVEYLVPKGSGDMGKLTIGQVAHGFKSMDQVGFGNSGSCNNNVVCPEWSEWSCQTRSVTWALQNGRDWCTGTLLNNTSEDGTPLILTANHCNPSNVSDWVFVFNWKSPSCSPSANASKDQTISGGRLLVKDGQSDFGLLELSERPPESYEVLYSGWDATGRTPQRQVGIHHPSGDVMKISLDDDPARGGNSNFWSVTWDDGTTEPGSSGSGLFDENFRLIGQLQGGSASCQNPNGNDLYGRLAVSWNNGASRYLDPENTGIKVMDAMGVGQCGGTSAWAQFEPDASTSCSGEVKFTDKSRNAVSWKWDFGNGESSTEQNPAHRFTEGGTYEVTLTVTGEEGDLATYSKSIKVSDMAEVKAIGDSVCTGLPALIRAEVPGDARVKWYDSPNATTPIAEGNSLVTQALNASTQFYLEAAENNSILKVGPSSNSFGEGGNYDNPEHGLFFEAKVPITLKSVVMYAGSAGERIVEIQSQNGGGTESRRYNLNSGRQRVQMDWSLDAGQYFITLANGSKTDLFRNSSNPDYPYEIENLVSISKSSAPGVELDYYYFFYDWEIQEQSCTSARIPVEATVSEVCTGIVASSPQGQQMRSLPGQKLQIFVEKPGNLYLYDVEGREVLRAQLKAGENFVEWKGLSNGLYFVKVPGIETKARYFLKDI